MCFTVLCCTRIVLGGFLYCFFLCYSCVFVVMHCVYGTASVLMCGYYGAFVIKKSILKYKLRGILFSLMRFCFCPAALPIGAHEPAWFMKEQHCSPDEAVTIHQDLGAKRSFAVHWVSHSNSRLRGPYRS